MNEETVTVAFEFDDAAIVSAIEQVQSQISEAESVRVSESVAAESVRVSERAESVEHHESDDLMFVSIGFMLVVAFGFVSGLIMSDLFKRR